MKTKGVLFLLFLFVLLLEGCVDVEVKTKINANGRGVQNWKFSSTALLASQLKKHIEQDPFFRDRQRKDEFKEGDYILTLEIPFQQVKELQSTGHEVRFEKTGFFKRSYTYTETWKPEFGTQGGLLKKPMGSLVPITVKVFVELPGKIVDSNADSMEGSVATWNITVSDLAESRVLQAKSTDWNLGMLMLLAFLVTIGSGVIVFLIVGLRRGRVQGNG